MNIAIRKGLWNFINRFEASLRVYSRARSGAGVASLSRTGRRQTLGAASTAGGPDAGDAGEDAGARWARLTARMHGGGASGEKRRFRMSAWVRRGGVIRRRLLWLVATVALYKI
jgi:hypothetical protein